MSGVQWFKRKDPTLFDSIIISSYGLFKHENANMSCSLRVYVYGGTELVAVTVAEAQNPRLAMARAVKLTFFRIVIFYILSVLFLGMVVPYNSSELAFAAGSTTSAAASPFVVAIKLAKIGGLDHVINACLLIFVLSAATSGTSYFAYILIRYWLI